MTTVATASAPSGIPATAEAAHRPDFQRAEYIAATPARDLCNDLMAGSEAIRAGGEKYLPRWPAEKKANYKLRAAIAQVARYYHRTVQASVGMICATPPALSDNADPLIAADWEDIDGRGTHGEVFAAQIATDAVNGGFAVILVDAPPIPDGLNLTLADEQALGLRPFWVGIPSERVLSWIVDVPDWAALLRDFADGTLTADQVSAYARQAIIRQVVIHEPTDAVSGTFGTRSVDRYRVLRLDDGGVTFTVYEKVPARGATGEHFAIVAAGTMLQAKRRPFRQIPIAPVYAGRKVAPFVASPPLLALAELNLDHYQVTADRRYLMRLCHAPTLFLAGFQEEDDGTGGKKKIEVGPNSVLISSDSTAKAEYVAADPSALDSSKEEKDDLVDQMATLGMSFIGRTRQATPETATGRQLDDAAENANHATVARGLQDGLEQALKFHAMYRGVPAPEVAVNTTYADPSVDPQMASVLWQAVATDKLDIESFIEYVSTGSLPDDIAMRLDVLKMAAKEAADNALASHSANTNPGPKPAGAIDPALAA